MNKNIIITDEDIDIIENKFLNQKGRFDSERRSAIKYIDNVDIIACAGSGKTTFDRETFLERKEKMQNQIEQLNLKQEKLITEERNKTNRKLSLNK